jgi:folate-binding protein YgfZ
LTVTTQLPQLTTGSTTLSCYGVIKVAGEDALSFLHNQLTQDFINLKEDQANFCVFCNAKGRIQASFIAIESLKNEILLITSADLVLQTVKRLSMFVLRSKVKITDATEQYDLLGTIGDENVPKGVSTHPWSHFINNPETTATHWVTLYPACGKFRFIRISIKGMQSHVAPSISVNDWQLSEILSGVCFINLPTFEAFVPQMINYESLNGINFKKGCYPGQEVVARSQFRGTIKRRGFIISCESALSSGDELFFASDRSQPCGKIVSSASHLGTYYAFASILTHFDKSSDLIVTAHNEAVSFHELPYSLRDDI